MFTIFQRLPCPYRSPVPATAERGLYALEGVLHPARKAGDPSYLPQPREPGKTLYESQASPRKGVEECLLSSTDHSSSERERVVWVQSAGIIARVG